MNNAKWQSEKMMYSRDAFTGFLDSVICEVGSELVIRKSASSVSKPNEMMRMILSCTAGRPTDLDGKR